MAQIRLKNAIGRTSELGQQVKLALNSQFPSYTIASLGDVVIGTVAQSVPNGYSGLINLINTVDYSDIIGWNLKADIASPTFTGTVTTPSLIVTDLTDGYVPYRVAATDKLGNSNIFYDGTNVGIWTTTPTARLNLPAGGTAASSAPLKFTTQSSPLATVEQGAMELVGNSLQFSQLARRRGIVMSQQVITATTTTGNTTTESAALIIASHGAGYFEIGKREEIELNGIIAQRSNPAAILTVRVKYDGVTKITITTPANTIVSARQFTLRVRTTVRTIGATGTLQMNAMLDINGLNVDPSASALSTINTTTAQETTVTFQWGEADVADTISVEQGYVKCVEPNR